MYLAVKIRINPMQIFVRPRYKDNKAQQVTCCIQNSEED